MANDFADEPLVSVDGMAEARKAIRQFDRTIVRDLDRELKTVAADAGKEARSEYRRRHPRRRSNGPRATNAVDVAKWGGARGTTWVTLNPNLKPWMLGQEFGSDRYPQFPGWSGAAPGGRGSYGYFFYPTLRKNQEEAQRRIFESLDRAVARAFPDK